MLVECDNEINMIVTDAIINYLWGEPVYFSRKRLARLSGQCTLSHTWSVSTTEVGVVHLFLSITCIEHINETTI